MTDFIELHPRARDLTGMVFGKLTVLGPVERRKFPAGAVHVYWLCQCECGRQKSINAYTMIAGTSESCGCVHREMARKIGKANIRHGMTNSVEFRTWSSMKVRCQNPDVPNYADYGGRGIVICERWEVFENFLEDMGMRPGPEFSLGRIDNNAGYFPENCRWETITQQTQNQRNNLVIEYQGRLGALASFFDGGVGHPDYYRVHQRIQRGGWSPERAFTEPVNSQFSRW